MDEQLDDSAEAIIDRLRRQIDGLQRNLTWRAQREEALRAELLRTQTELARARVEDNREIAAKSGRVVTGILRLEGKMRRAYSHLRTRLRARRMGLS